MFFDDSEEKKLFEDLQFKRRVEFVDDDNIISIELKSFSKTANEEVEVASQSVQVNIQNELVSTGMQTRARKSKEVQTELDESREITDRDVDSNRVRRLFEKRAGLVEDAIMENNQSKAFNNYDVDWYDGGATITNPFILTNKQLLKEEELHVVEVEWNCTGSTVFCAYGRYDHESVCTHRGALCSWNIDRLRIDVNKPDTTIETVCCISSIAAHPEYPAIIAVGLFNGEVHVYDIRQSDQLVASITDKKELHRDEVTSLKWFKDPKSSKKKYLLLSSSRDGKLLAWNALPTKNQLKLYDGFMMLIDYLPRNHHRVTGAEMSVSSVCLNMENKETFIVGCDSGGLFKCSFLAATPVQSKWDTEFPADLKSPIELAFDAQYGPIYSISHSPFHRNLILTCGTDSEVKMYSLLHTSSLMNFCPDNGYLYSVDWSPTRPCVFACGSHKGNILIYDILDTASNSSSSSNTANSLASLCRVVPASDGPVYTVSFNKQRNGYLASGDKAGVVKIWKLSQDLIRVDPGELRRLDDISERPFDEEEEEKS